MFRRVLTALAVASLAATGSISSAPHVDAMVVPVISIGSATVVETFARGDWVPALVPVTMDRVAPVAVTVDYVTGASTALAGPDFEPTAGSVTIPAGSLGTSVWVFVKGDTLPESDEWVEVLLTNPVNAALGRDVGTVVIRDRQEPGVVVTDLRPYEPDDPALAVLVEATVAIDSPQGNDVKIDWETVELPPWPPGAAYEAGDYLFRNGSVTIPAGSLFARIQLWVRGDPNGEIPEDFAVDILTLDAPILDDRGLVTILDNDPPGSPATRRASVTSDGQERNAATLNPEISDDGRYVAFQTTAQLSPVDTNVLPDIYVHDRLTGRTSLVSQQPSGFAPTDFGSFDPDISGDGRHIVYSSTSKQIDPPFTPGAQIYRYDTATQQTIRVSETAGGIAGNASSDQPAISDDGSVVAFRTLATNLTPIAPVSANRHVYAKDLGTGGVDRVSVDGASFTGAANPDVSGDAAVVVYDSDDPDQVAGDTNGVRDVFAKDAFLIGSPVRVSVDTGGGEATGASSRPAVNADGTVIAFQSAATDLIAVDGNGVDDVFVRDLNTATTERVSVDSLGGEATGRSEDADISSDGNRVAFSSFATDLLGAMDTNGFVDVFVHDRTTAATTRLSVTSDGVQAGAGGGPEVAIAGDGDWIAFTSLTAKLVHSDGNGARDVFVRGVFD